MSAEIMSIQRYLTMTGALRDALKFTAYLL